VFNGGRPGEYYEYQGKKTIRVTMILKNPAGGIFKKELKFKAKKIFQKDYFTVR